MSEQDKDIKVIRQSFLKESITISPEDIEMEARLVEIDIRKEHLESSIQDRIERKYYAMKVYLLLIVFLCVVFGIVIANGIDCFSFHLSDNVLMVILTTSSANVIGIFAIVMRYLFKER